MSSVEPPSLASSDVTEKSSIDFGVKAVSLKTQDTSRLLQAGGPLRSLSTTPAISRQTLSYPPQHSSIVTNANLKTVNVNRVSSGSAATQSGMSSGPAITAKPPHTTCPITSTTASLHGSTAFLIPRAGGQVVPRAASAISRANMNVQPVSSVQTLVRTQSPMGAQSGTVNHVRAPSPGSLQPRTVVTTRCAVPVGKPVPQVRPDAIRPMMIPRPLTLTTATQLHITTTDKSVKVPAVPMRPAFCPVPTYVTQNQTTTILQRTDAIGIQTGPPGTVTTTPIRVAPPLAPLLTQRVAVSVPARFNLSQHVTVACNIGQTTRVPALANRAPTPPTGLPTPTKLGVTTVAGGAILATTGRLTYATGQVVTATSTVPPRMPTIASINQVSGKPGMTTPAVVTTGSRMPVVNHQITQSGGKPRFASVRPPSVATTLGPPTGGLLVVSGGNHVAVRSTLVPPPGSKVIQQTVSGSIQLAPTTVANKPAPLPTPPPHPISSMLSPVTQLTPVISKNDSYKPPIASRVSCQPKMYPSSPAQSAMSNAETDNHHHPHPHHPLPLPLPLPLHLQQMQQTQTSAVYIPAQTHKPNNPPGLITAQTTTVDRSANTSTISTYTMPSGASYIYEAPSSYQLATNAPLVARPLSPDAQLVSRQLSADGQLIARPYTPGLIAASQAVRYNPMMILEPTVPVVANASSDQLSADASTPGKLTSSPRPSILRKRDNEGNVNVKVVKNLNTALGGAASRSRTPSPPTPPTSLHCETNQTGAEAGPSSNGSTTISATSSPCPEDGADPDRPQEMSPRKKPRKQLLNDANDSMDMEFISEDRSKKGKKTAIAGVDEKIKIYNLKKPSDRYIFNKKHFNWETRRDHYQRYSDVMPSTERLNVTDLASQPHVVQRIKGWKIYHLTTQFENLSHMENCVLDRLEATFKAMETHSKEECDKDISRGVSELIKGTIQRSKVILEQINDAKSQMMKGIDHEVHVSETISRYANKRIPKKKRNKY